MTHQPYAVSVNGTMISAVTRQNVAPQSTVTKEVNAGSPYPKTTQITAQTNQATMSTLDLAVALGLLGSEGAAVSGTGVILYQLELDDQTGLPKTTASHRSLKIARGKTIPVRLSCDHQRDAELEMLTHALIDPATFDQTDKATYPIVATDSVALPTGLAGDKRWTLADTKIAGITFDCPLNVSIDFGINLTTEGCKSDIFDGTIVIAEITPMIRIRGKDIKKFASASIPADGKACTHANTEIFLRQRLDDSAGFEVSTGSTHIKFTADGLAHWANYHDAQNNNRVESELQIDCRHDGTNVPLVVATGAAMTV
ncbi:hypothetical protein K227x_64240 [Rubripirellula lacrimiformis]|uniref:Uncharacterized protein n=1 Tax=Rubripirellula lacrimiformis TaxID=1930273 RepID=A0A517NLH8_9BACT|nr:hypothetical protein [Rubripirellula lacrimiformis]QDT07994.1 hypothetical protein K227x_64240 [Rubripirellula lacrimiformis]